MSKIKECILKGTDKNPKILYEYDKGSDHFIPIIWIKGRRFTRNITVCIFNNVISRSTITMKVILIPLIRMAICRSIWVTTSGPISEKDLNCYIIRNQIRLCTFDDIEDWINKHFQIG